MIVSAISLALLLAALVFSAWLLVSGMAAELRQPALMSKQTQIVIRMIWNVVIEAANLVILIGAVRMKRLRSLGFARAACVLAIIPCIGPCLVLGIPFGVWGLAVLNDPRVQDGFAG